ncbi:MAG: DUF3341 domain-containing protein [bacterium]
MGKTVGIAGKFADPDSLRRTAIMLAKMGYRQFECLTPFPLHGLNEELGEERSRVSYIAGIGAILGGSALLYFIWWINVKAYPIVLSGKPFFSYQAFFPPIFAICVLFAAFGAVLGFGLLSRIKFYHPYQNSSLISSAYDDGFVLVVDSNDPQFNVEKLIELMNQCGAVQTEIIEE